MNDLIKEPTGSTPSGPAAGHQPLPKSTQLTFSQHVFIWLLIIVVGVLFGMGGSMGSLMDNTKAVRGVSPVDIERWRAIDDKLGKALGRPSQSTSDEYAKNIKIERVAASLGLEPSGKVLDQMVDDFLDRPLGEGRTIRDALLDAKGGENEISRQELSIMIAHDTALYAFQNRHDAVPAVPLGVASGMAMVAGDKVEVQSAVLDASSLLQPVKPDAPEIQTTYETMRSLGRFTKQPSETLTIAYADMPALILKAKSAVTAAQVQAYYDAHQHEPRFTAAVPPAPAPSKPSGKSPTPAPAPVAKPASPQPKPLAQVRDEIITLLATEQATKQAHAAAAALDADGESLEGQKDNASFLDAAHHYGLATKTNVVVEQPVRDPMMARFNMTDNTELDLGPGLGRMKDEAGLFAADKEPGFISRALALQGPPASMVVLRLESRTEAGFKPLSAVKDEVIHHLQGQRAYVAFIAAANAVRQQAQKLGANGLSTYLASPSGAVWKSRTSADSLSAAEVLTPPPAQLGLTPPDGQIAASLAMPDHPVLMVSEEDRDELPQVKLVQATSYVPAPPPADVAARAQQSQRYRRELQQYSFQNFKSEIDRITQ